MKPKIISHRLKTKPDILDSQFFTLPLGEGAPVFTLTLAGLGDMSVKDSRANRDRLCVSLRIPPSALAGLVQVHSKKVYAAESLFPLTDHSPPPEGDGLVTSREGLFLSVTAADCMPIALFDAETKAFGIVHSGWKGTGIAAEAIRIMGERYGTRASDLVAVAGPSIDSCCYSVPEERALLFREQWGPEAALFREGKWFLSLWNANRRILARAGVRIIHHIADCTCCSPFLGSYRREGPGAYTHMLATIGYFK